MQLQKKNTKRLLKNMNYDYERSPQGIRLEIHRENINHLFLFEQISKSLIKKNKLKILEIGTGGGRNLQAIYQEFGSKVELFGTDISATAINYAKSLKIGKFYQIKSDIIPTTKKFDFVLMIDILEHLETKADVIRTLGNAITHLNNSGYIYISVPIELNRFSLTWLFSKMPYFKDLTKLFFGHSIQFNIQSFFELIDLKKLKVTEVFYSVHFLTQLQVLLFFYLPKILVQFFFGKETANDIRDSGEIINERKHPVLSLLKSILINFGRPLSCLSFKESNHRKNSAFAAGNMHILLAKIF